MGVNSLTRSFALEWSDYGIRANGISPGAIADTAGTISHTLGLCDDRIFARDITSSRKCPGAGTAKLGGMGGNSKEKEVSIEQSGACLSFAAAASRSHH